MELSKSDKRIARTIIEKGLMKEFEKGLNKADKILTNWKEGKGDARESYYALFKHISGFDKGIARRYDGMSNHDLLFIVVQQLYERLIDKEELEAFSEEGKSIIQRILSLRDM
jgi:hypothetical protein